MKCADYGEEVKRSLKAFLNKKLPSPALKWEFELFPPSRAFPKRNLNEILAIREAVEGEGEAGPLLLLALLAILPRVSIVKKDGGVLKIDKRKKALPVREAFKRKVKQIIADLGAVKGPTPRVFLGDARYASREADLIFTSPPYLNNVDYSKVYGLELSLLTLSPTSTKEMRAKALRSFITNSSPPSYIPEEAAPFASLPIVANYFADIERFIKQCSAERLCLVVSNAVVKGVHVPVDEMIALMGLRLGFKARIVVGAERVADVKPKRIRVRESVVELCL